ncbi:MAG: c-type cytochrome [Gammaproteobacteria bacterium]|nr:c-type cytochrome [Gammaproteobacteria bacterium]
MSRIHMVSIAGLLCFLLSSAASAADNKVDYQAELQPAPAGKAEFQPPREETIPNNEFGKMVKYGEKLFTDTQTLRGKYVGNNLNCVNCHLDRGRLADAAPMWAAYVYYPAYRKKNDMVNTLGERIQGCFRYSMNGKPPAVNSDIIKAMETYFFWLAKGAPVGENMKGRGYPKLEKPAASPDIARGKQVFKNNCAVCHGANGQGQMAEGKVVFPPLWGKDSYNWGAGMHRVSTAAAFIKANMPLSKPNSLSLQEAWDVAAFINSRERPQDPRYNGNFKETKAKYHKSDYYGEKVDGRILGEHAYPNPLK